MTSDYFTIEEGFLCRIDDEPYTKGYIYDFKHQRWVEDRIPLDTMMPFEESYTVDEIIEPENLESEIRRLTKLYEGKTKERN